MFEAFYKAFMYAVQTTIARFMGKQLIFIGIFWSLVVSVADHLIFWIVDLVWGIMAWAMPQQYWDALVMILCRGMSLLDLVMDVGLVIQYLCISSSMFLVWSMMCFTLRVYVKMVSDLVVPF